MSARKTLYAAALVLGSFGLAPAPALADNPGVYFIQCDADTCYEITCREMPNINGLDWGGAGCAVIGSFPRPREVGTD